MYRSPLLAKVLLVSVFRWNSGNFCSLHLSGSGLWMPEAQPLALLRRDIDRRPEKLKTVLTDPTMRKLILNGIPKDDKKAVKAFADQNKENMLKTKPKVRSPPWLRILKPLRPQACTLPEVSASRRNPRLRNAVYPIKVNYAQRCMCDVLEVCTEDD